MSELQHIARTVGETRDELLVWVRSLLDEAGVDLPVTGVLPTDGRPALFMMPYQTVLESQSTVPMSPLVPSGSAGPPAGVTPDWVSVAHAMTRFLVEHYPKRARKAPGLGPLDAQPKLELLPKAMGDWYRAQDAEWGSDQRGILPSVAWRQGFSFVVRYAAIVTAEDATDGDRKRLQALAVLASGVRQRRFFELGVAPPPCSSQLLSLIEAMRDSCDGELSAALAAGAASIVASRRSAVGVYPHHELTDADLAFVLRTLHQPMQPAVVFALRLSLGAGPVLEPGALPALPPIEMGKRS